MTMTDFVELIKATLRSALVEGGDNFRPGPHHRLVIASGRTKEPAILAADVVL